MNTQPIVYEPENGSPASQVLSRGQSLQQVRTSYATAVAVQKPRQLQIVERRLLDEAALAGEDFYYGWGAGEDRIEGPSKDLACAAARCWGNCAIETMPVQDLGDSWIFTAAFVDLETGFTMTRQFRQSKKWVVYGKMDDERKDDVRFQIGQSKAIRNVVINSLPPGLVRNAMEKAKEGVRAKIEEFVNKKGLPAAVDMVLKALAKCGVKEPLVLAKCSVASRNAIGIDHLVVLRGDLAAIENGQERPEALYPEPTAEARTQEVREKLKPQAPPQPAAASSATHVPAPAENPPQLAEGEIDPLSLQIEDTINDLTARLGQADRADEVEKVREVIQADDKLPEAWKQTLLARCDERAAQINPAPTKPAAKPGKLRQV